MSEEMPSLITFDKLSAEQKDKIVKALKTHGYPYKIKSFDDGKFWVYTTYAGVKYYWNS